MRIPYTSFVWIFCSPLDLQRLNHLVGSSGGENPQVVNEKNMPCASAVVFSSFSTGPGVSRFCGHWLVQLDEIKNRKTTCG